MAHLFESGFLVKEAAWHKLGTVIQEAPTVEDGIRLAGLDWKVSLNPLYLNDGRAVDHKAVVRETDKKVLGVVGPQWQPLQNTKAFEFFNPFLESKEVSLETAGSLREGKIIWVLAKINSCKGEVIKGDPIQRYFMLSNAHYAGKAVSVGFTDVRVVCANTMAIAEQAAESKLMRVVHSKRLEINLDTIQSTIDMANRSFVANIEKLKMLTKKGINSKDIERFVDVVFFKMPAVIDLSSGEEMENDFSKRQLNRRSFIVDKIEQLIEEGIGSDIKGVKGTAYGLYQATTEFFTHYDGSDYNSRLDKLWLGANKNRNERALEYLLVG
jgi:phage/plasmid-like protein (TIGR03299 family)